MTPSGRPVPDGSVVHPPCETLCRRTRAFTRVLGPVRYVRCERRAAVSSISHAEEDADPDRSCDACEILGIAPWRPRSSSASSEFISVRARAVSAASSCARMAPAAWSRRMAAAVASMRACTTTSRQSRRSSSSEPAASTIAQNSAAWGARFRPVCTRLRSTMSASPTEARVLQPVDRTHRDLCERPGQEGTDGVGGAREPAVERGPRHTDLTHDRVDVESSCAISQEQLGGRVENRIALSLEPFSHWGHGTTTGQRNRHACADRQRLNTQPIMASCDQNPLEAGRRSIFAAPRRPQTRPIYRRHFVALCESRSVLEPRLPPKKGCTRCQFISPLFRALQRTRAGA